MTDRASRVEDAVAEIAALLGYQRRGYVGRVPPRGISLPQVYLLISIQERGALSMSELAELVGVTLPSTSAIVDRMEEHGLVARRRDGADRRVVHVDITERGRSVIAEMAGIKEHEVRSLVSGLTDSELKDVIRGMRAIHAGLERALGEGGTLRAGRGTQS